MTLHEIAQRLALVDLTPELNAGERSPAAGFASDLLSDVLAHARSGALLVTVQVHLNVIAVAVHAELAGVIFAAGRSPDESVRAKAVAENVPLFRTDLPAFEVAGRLYELGLRGL